MWLAVNCNGTEKAFHNKPVKKKGSRKTWYWEDSETYDETRRTLRTDYSMVLPKGTIEKLLKKKLNPGNEPVEYKETFFNINLNLISRKFPGFIIRTDRSEIIGFNPETRIHMVISDGTCVSYDKKWLVHQYKIKPEIDFNWMEWKYILDEFNIADKILEEWEELA